MENPTTERVSVIRWFVIVLIIALASAGAAEFVSIGTREAYLWALGYAALPIVVWLESTHLRAVASHEPADRFLMSWAGMQMVLWLLAMYAGDLASCCR